MNIPHPSIFTQSCIVELVEVVVSELLVSNLQSGGHTLEGIGGHELQLVNWPGGITNDLELVREGSPGNPSPGNPSHEEHPKSKTKHWRNTLRRTEDTP